MGDLRAPRVLIEGLIDIHSGSGDEAAVVSRPTARNGDALGRRREWLETSILGMQMSSLQTLGAGRVSSVGTMSNAPQGQRVKLRRVFILLSEYFRQSRRGPDRPQMAGLVEDIVLMARDCFEAIEPRRPDIVDPAAAERGHCLDDLEAFARDLRDGRGLSGLEVMHAMDGLIVQCVLLDDQHPATPPQV